VVLGRLFDGRLLDCVELGVAAITPVEKFGGAAAQVQQGNRPAVLFAGDGFDRDPALRAARSMLLDLLRGRQVETLDLAALDRVVLALAPGGSAAAANGDASAQRPPSSSASPSAPRALVLRQYAIRLKKSGTPIPRVALVEIGPRLDFVVRRHRAAPPDLEREALRQPPKPKAKKVRCCVSESERERARGAQQRFVFRLCFFCSG
jgi:ribosome production factor 2